MPSRFVPNPLSWTRSQLPCVVQQDWRAVWIVRNDIDPPVVVQVPESRAPGRGTLRHALARDLRNLGEPAVSEVPIQIPRLLVLGACS